MSILLQQKYLKPKQTLVMSQLCPMLAEWPWTSHLTGESELLCYMVEAGIPQVEPQEGAQVKSCV
jgi:hypothetical protein